MINTWIWCLCGAGISGFDNFDAVSENVNSVSATVGFKVVSSESDIEPVLYCPFNCKEFMLQTVDCKAMNESSGKWWRHQEYTESHVRLIQLGGDAVLVEVPLAIRSPVGTDLLTDREKRAAPRSKSRTLNSCKETNGGALARLSLLYYSVLLPEPTSAMPTTGSWLFRAILINASSEVCPNMFGPWLKMKFSCWFFWIEKRRILFITFDVSLISLFYVTVVSSGILSLTIWQNAGDLRFNQTNLL